MTARFKSVVILWQSVTKCKLLVRNSINHAESASDNSLCRVPSSAGFQMQFHYSNKTHWPIQILENGPLIDF